VIRGPSRRSGASRSVGVGALLFLLVAGVVLLVAFSLRRSPGPGAESAENGTTGDIPPGQPSDDRPTRKAPGTARAVPRFVRTQTNVRPNTIHTDLMEDAGARQAAEAQFNQQSRDEGWAPRMEQHLRDRLSPGALERLGLQDLALRIDSLECRHYGCQLKVEWSMDFAASRDTVLHPPGGSPIRYLNDNAGPLGVALMRHTREQGRNRRMRETFLVFFKDDVREPDAWPGSSNPGPNWAKSPASSGR
jgi:hypothetical protein